MFRQEEGTTIRPTSTSLLTIDSEDRFVSYPDELDDVTSETSSPYNFVYRKNESLMNGFITRLAVTEVVFPFLVPNINAKTNQMILNWASDGHGFGYVMNIPVGFYYPYELANQIQTIARSNPSANMSGFNMTYGVAPDTGNPRFHYNLPQGSNIPTSVWFSPVPYNTPTYPFGIQTKQMFNLMGFTKANSTPGLNYGGVGDYTLCQYTRYVDIVCPQLTYNQPLKDTSTQRVVRDSLCRIYLDQVSGGFQSNIKRAGDVAFCPTGCAPFTIYHNFTVPKQIKWIPNQPIPGFLQIQVYDDSGDILSDIVNVPGSNREDDVSYANWSMTLLVTEN